MTEHKAPESEARKGEAASELRARGRDTANNITEECNRLSRAFLYAGLETIKQTADVTSTFVDRTYERNNEKGRDSAFKQMTSLPWDMTEAFFDALDESVKSSKKIIDKFYERYESEKAKTK